MKTKQKHPTTPTKINNNTTNTDNTTKITITIQSTTQPTQTKT